MPQKSMSLASPAVRVPHGPLETQRTPSRTVFSSFWFCAFNCRGELEKIGVKVERSRLKVNTRAVSQEALLPLLFPFPFPLFPSRF
jgi:hypothetical protein